MTAVTPRPDFVRQIFERRRASNPSSLLQRMPTTARFKRHAARAKTLPLGIDFGTTALRVAQAVATPEGPALQHLATVEVPEAWRQDAALHAQQLPLLLRDLVQRQGWQGAAAAALPLSRVQLKTIALPAMPAPELRHALSWELRQQEPNSDAATFDYLPLGASPAGGQKQEWLVITAAPEDVHEPMRMLTTAGLRPYAVDLAPLAWAACAPAQPGLSLLLELGCETASLSFLLDGALQFARALTINGRSLTQAIAENCSVSVFQAEQLKQEHGLTPERPAIADTPEAAAGDAPSEPATLSLPSQVHHALALGLEKLVSDIEYSFKFYSFQLTRSQIKSYDRLWIAGGTAALPGLTAFLQQRLQVPVERLDPLAAVRVTEAYRANPAAGPAHTWGVAIGLALRGMEGP